MKVRPFKETDTAAVSALWQEIFPDDPPRDAPALVIKQKLQCHPALVVVGDLDGVIVGAVLSGYDEH